jgi:hypothetical protein
LARCSPASMNMVTRWSDSPMPKPTVRAVTRPVGLKMSGAFLVLRLVLQDVRNRLRSEAFFASMLHLLCCRPARVFL